MTPLTYSNLLHCNNLIRWLSPSLKLKEQFYFFWLSLCIRLILLNPVEGLGWKWNHQEKVSSTRILQGLALTIKSLIEQGSAANNWQIFLVICWEGSINLEEEYHRLTEMRGNAVEILRLIRGRNEQMREQPRVASCRLVCEEVGTSLASPRSSALSSR